MTNTIDVLGIGNAIVDIIGHCDDAFLESHGLAKGHMQLADEAGVKAIYADVGPTTEISGGSAANTIAGVASFGGTAAYIGKTAPDQFGEIFAHDLNAMGVTYRTAPKAGSEPTARSLILVTPDGERTMNTFLGVSPEFEENDVDPELIAQSRIVYLEGYLFDRPQAQAAFRKAAQIGRENGCQIALTLSDGFCVDRHRDAFLDLIKNDIDILFANESELMALTGADAFDTAVRDAQGFTGLLAATRSEHGSVLLADGDPVLIPATRVDKVKDTTGAGDLYAAGVLFGLSRDLDLQTCGQLGSLAAAEVISHVGARPSIPLSALARDNNIPLSKL